MSKQSSSTLKSYFQTGEIPTQDNFASLIDSCLNLVDAGITIDAQNRIAFGGTPLATVSVQSQVNTPITGTVTVTKGSTTVMGTGTKFTSELAADDLLSIDGTIYSVMAVASDASLTIKTIPALGIAGIQAFKDAGVSLMLCDASEQVRLHLDKKGVLHVPGSINAATYSGSGANLSDIPAGALTGSISIGQLPDIPADKISGPFDSLTATGNISAASFSGSGANLTGISAGALSGELSLAQLPDIPAAKISGQLTAAQIPDLSDRDMLFYTPAPCINSGDSAQINWQTDSSYDLRLDYQNLGTLVSLSSKNTGGITPGSGQYTVAIEQSTLFTLTATGNSGHVVAQRQIWVQIAVPSTLEQQAKQLYEKGETAADAIPVLVKNFNLSGATPGNIGSLASALKAASFPSGDIYQDIPRFYGAPMSQACVTALIQAMGD